MSRLVAAAVVVTSFVFCNGGVSAGEVVGAPSISTSVIALSASEMFEGRIVLVTKASLTIVAKNGDNLMFMIANDCKVTRDGKPSSVEMLGAGDRVLIGASNEADRKIANAIMARGPERPVR